MKRPMLRTYFVLATISAVAVAWPAGAARPLTVEDTLALETVSGAQPSPNGQHILLIKTVPATARADFGQDLVFGPKSGELFSIDLRGDKQPRPLINVPGETYALGPFSPNSQRVLIYWIADRKVGLGSYDFKTKQFTRFAYGPQFHHRADLQPLWLSNDEVMYTAQPEGDQPVDIFGRPEAARKLSELWERSWSGQVPSVIASESRADGGGTTPREGWLVRVNVQTGAANIVADGMFTDLRLSKDARYIAALRQYTAAQPPAGPNLDWTSDRRFQLVIFDRRSMTPTFLSDGFTVGIGSLEWAPNDDKLAFFAWNPDGTSTSGLYHVYDVSQRRLSSRPHTGLDLVSERERGWFPRPERVAWLGDGIAVSARALSSPASPPTFTHRDYSKSQAEPGIGWFLLQPDGSIQALTSGLDAVSPILVAASAGKLIILGDGQLWQISPDANRTPLLERRHQNLGLAFPPTVRVGVQNEPAVLVAAEKGSTSYLIPDLTGRRPLVLIKARGQESLLTVSPDGTALSASDERRSTWIRLRRQGNQVPIMRLNQHLEEVDLAERRQISYRGARHEELTACLLLPPGYVEGQRYPTIVDIYPGRTGKCAPSTVNLYNDEELLAARGYIVLRPGNPPDSIRAPDGPIAGMAGAVEKAISTAVTRGYADPDRIGLWGTSQGGISSLWLATQMKEFKAIVSSQGWADLADHYLGADYQNLLFPEEVPYARHTARYEAAAGGEFNIGGTLWQKRQLYVNNSPIMHADKVTAPVMLIHSDMDIFPLWGYQEMYGALYRLRKPACFLVYMGEGHWPESPANRKDLWERVFRWFDFYLRDGSTNGCANTAKVGFSVERR